MILFAICTLLYALALLLVRPAPASLKAEAPGFGQHVASIKVSLLLGLGLMGIFLFTSAAGFIETETGILESFAMRGGWALDARTLLRVLAHWLLHIDIGHLIANLVLLGLLSVYERRVGAQRFLAVLLAACLASAPSAFFYPESTVICGISGGLFGLAAAYFVDERALTTKDWLTGIALFAVIVGLFMLNDALRGSSANDLDYEIDHLGHFLGALGAIAYCRLRPLR